MPTEPNNLPPGLVTRLQTWVAHPFTSDMDLFSVFLTTGLVVIIVFFWTRVLGDITEAL